MKLRIKQDDFALLDDNEKEELLAFLRERQEEAMEEFENETE